jgi:hypothetical protein
VPGPVTRVGGTLAGVVLRQFERRLERLVEGGFNKAFRSGLEPVEIARHVVREMDRGRVVGPRGPIAPNRFTAWISPDDAARFASFLDALQAELTTVARDHAHEEGYGFVGAVRVTVESTEQMRPGDLQVDAEVTDEVTDAPGSLVLGDGRRIGIGNEPVVIGRMPDCAIQLQDPKLSRRHAEVRREPDGFRVHDLGSTNGTSVNGTLIRDHLLAEGDVITVGSSPIRFEGR